MESIRKIIVELDGRAVYCTKSYKRARQVAWKLIRMNKGKEVIVQHMGIICGI